jgi:CRISPR-associated protein Cas5d
MEDYLPPPSRPPSSRLFRVRARGDFACFTRPEMKVERVSYEVMTPSAARGLIEAVLWKPAICWVIEKIRVLAPIRWASVRRNEVNDKMSIKGGDFFVETRRAQRNTVLLRDVDYVVEAYFELTPAAGPGDTLAKFEAMMARRLERGQCFHAPYLGCREFAADLSPAPEQTDEIDAGVDRPLGLMLYDIHHPRAAAGRRGSRVKSPPPVPLFFEARLRDGVLHVPLRAAVLAENGVEVGQ